MRESPCPNREVKAFGLVLDATCNVKGRLSSHVKSSQRVNETAELLPLPLLVPCTKGKNRKFIRKNDSEKTKMLDRLIVRSLLALLFQISVWFPPLDKACTLSVTMS